MTCTAVHSVFHSVCYVYIHCRQWQYELERRRRGQKPRLLVAMIKTSWWRFIIQGAIIFLEVIVHSLDIDLLLS